MTATIFFRWPMRTGTLNALPDGTYADSVHPFGVLAQSPRRRALLEFRAASPPVPPLAAPCTQLRLPALLAAARYAPKSVRRLGRAAPARGAR